ncbi:tetratricopeptide repeat protein [Mangrovibacterium lignilyticum]|uniref:tetratricopeptide repeat protein n=1 Tax=Mangrovibacterium lignilyticum TaxID=2668052 RepID=UPI0013D21D3D|nr:tetratricopeptide repeat protein [Mangrovibacterium lignilyticum]
MAKNKDLNKEDNLSEVESALTKSEQFVEDNQKILSIVIGAAVVIVAAYLGFTKLYIQPKEKAAQEEMFFAEQYFEKDSFNLAINGDGTNPGFLDIIDDYGVTPAGKLANYYVGISYLHMGQYEDALTYLNDFSTDDLVLAPVLEGAKGDCYAELEQPKKAISAYKAAASTKNEFTTPVYLLKAGQMMETQGEFDDALEVYTEIKKDYPTSTEARTIDKYIARVEMELKK